MRTASHIVIGAAAAALPDIALTFAAGREWLPRDHPVIRAHAFLHQSAWGFVVAAMLGWGSHLVADHYTQHNLTETTRGRRPFRW
jgi:hypothetical protein